MISAMTPTMSPCNRLFLPLQAEAANVVSTIASAAEGYPFVPPAWAPSVFVPLTGLVIPAVAMASLFVYIEVRHGTNQQTTFKWQLLKHSCQNLRHAWLALGMQGMLHTRKGSCPVPRMAQLHGSLTSPMRCLMHPCRRRPPPSKRPAYSKRRPSSTLLL